MRKLLVILTILAAVASTAAGPNYYRLMVEAGVNTDELIEGAVSYERSKWAVELRGRDTEARDLELDRSCLTDTCRLIERAGGELDLTIYVEPWKHRGLRHGPVVRYTRHGSQDETGFVGYRVYLQKGRR